MTGAGPGRPYLGATTPEGVRVVEAVTSGLRARELQVRWEVFVQEQGVPMVLEVDARDFREDVVHLVALDRDGGALGVVRVIPDGGGRHHLGRLAVRHGARGRGIGSVLVRAVHELVEATSTPPGVVPVVVLDAQVRAIGFYESLGYVRGPGGVFLDAGIEHVTMSRRLDGEARH